jgi:hypothetical protein
LSILLILSVILALPKPLLSGNEQFCQDCETPAVVRHKLPDPALFEADEPALADNEMIRHLDIQHLGPASRSGARLRAKGWDREGELVSEQPWRLLVNCLSQVDAHGSIPHIYQGTALPQRATAPAQPGPPTCQPCRVYLRSAQRQVCSPVEPRTTIIKAMSSDWGASPTNS